MSDSGAAFVTFMLVATAAVGFLCSAWLWGNYRVIAPTLPGRDRLVLQAFVVISIGATVVAGFFGFLALRRIAGHPPYEWASSVTLIIAELIFLTPVYLVAVTLLVRQDREKRGDE